MKKISMFFAGLFFLLLSLNVNAQEKKGAEYFAGTWSVLVKGAPDGDRKMNFVLDNKDGKVSGVVQDTTGKQMAKIDNAEVKEDEITVYFNTNGYDVNVSLKKKDDDHATGSVMGMFDAEAERVKKAK